ncbi:MAG: DoxX family protein [Rhodoglobus sp.]
MNATTANPVSDRAHFGTEPRFSGAALALLRIGVAVLWMQNAAWKVPPDFGREADKGLYFWATHAVDNPVFAPYSWFVETVFLPNIEIFGWGVLLAETALGAFLLIGLATRLWALIGIAQTIAITLSVLNTPNEWHWSYYLMLLAHVVLFATAAGRHFGIDGLLRPRWLASKRPLARMLVRAS